MSTLDLPGLTKRLEGLGLGPIPQFLEANLLNNPLDIGRSYLAEILANLVGCDLITAYNSIQCPEDIFRGSDLAVPLPKLCRGASCADVALDLTQRVRNSLPFAIHCDPD
jgi:arginyl-tRNA synthetase